MINIFKKKDKNLDVEEIEVQSRIVATSYADLLEKYDERTEEIIELLREKTENLFSCKSYYDTALTLKEEVKDLKVELGEQKQETIHIKNEIGDNALFLISNGLCIKPQDIKEKEILIAFLKLIQYTDRNDLPLRNIIAAMKRVKLTPEELEENYLEIYNNLKMKDWSF